MEIYQRGSRGLDIIRLQIRLQELGLYRKGLDDTFGAGVESAVQAFQAQRGMPRTGVVDGPTWTALFAGPSPALAAMQGKPLAYRVLALAARFETSAGPPDCFCGLAGDFDGQGISFGVLQWNLGQGTLQPMFESIDARNPALLPSIFGDDYLVLKKNLARDRASQLAWARTLQSPGKKVADPWRSYFLALGRTTECQEWQVEGAAKRYARARKLCEMYRLWSQRAIALLFDILVQNGSIQPPVHSQIMADFQQLPITASQQERELQRMRIIANRRAEAANKEFVADVRRRKLTIAEGVGVVHGLGFDLERQYDIRLVPAAAQTEPAPTEPVPVVAPPMAP